MNNRKKVELIAEILDRYDDGECLYCGGTLNGDLENEDFDDGYSDDWCDNCSKEIDPYDDWEEACLMAIDKVIHDKPFKA
ncbi:MAG: hypothetical protein ACFE8G_07755 [Candidatus Hermodarchaeota archaeon]